MKEFFKGLFVLIIIVVLIILLVLSLMFGGLWARKYFAPRHENIRREVFKQTRSYNESKIKQLSKYRFEYLAVKE